MIIRQCDFDTISSKLKTHIRSLSSPVDSFIEDRILKSVHYEILQKNCQIGYFSIFENTALTQFYLEKENRTIGQHVLTRAKRHEELRSALVPTCDEFFLSHALDECKRIEIQAYFFQDSRNETPEDRVLNELAFRIAEGGDRPRISEKTGDFFENLEQRIARKEIYIGEMEDAIVSFGIIEKSKVYENIASIGVFTAKGFRQKGIGRNTVLFLKRECYQNKLRPIAGCWYYNHNSKKTLESAGMFTQTRLLKIFM